METRTFVNGRVCTIVLLLLGFLTECSSLGGVFELRLRSFANPPNRDVEGLCCSLNESDCRTKCFPKFRICVKNYQVTIDPSGGCFFGETLTDVMDFSGRNSSVFHFPFNFRWPGTFSLIIEAFQPSLNGGSGSGSSSSSYHSKNNITSTTTTSQQRLLSRMAIQQYLDISEAWKQREWKSGEVSLKYEYRVRCLPDYYGDACDKTCRARDDKFGHYTCDGDGERRCREGWSGEYCEVAICTPGCSPTHGTCSTPATCDCHQGWEGPTCDSCTRYPGCKHGRCTKPFGCECEEGWGGLFCNQDLNYCTNHRPCMNGGTCFNTGQGSYTCECSPGFEGADCEVVRGGLGDDKKCWCENGGVCRDNGTALYCDCPEPFTGPNCRSSPPPPNCPCLHNGTCLNPTNPSSPPTCLCPPTHTGPLCAVPTHCPLGFTGPTCTTPISLCLTAPCANGGSCLTLPNSQFLCKCKPGFTGKDCSEKCDATCGLLMETEELRQELTTQHVIFVVIVSVATPLMVVVAVAVVVLLKKKKELERRRNDEMANQQNEANLRGELEKNGGGGGGGSGGGWNSASVIVNSLNNNKKLSNLDLSGGGRFDKCGKSPPIQNHSPLPAPPSNYSNFLPSHSPLLLDPYNPPPLLHKQNNTPQSSPVILNKLHNLDLVYDLNLATEV